jgi:hypothetical protein
MDTTATPPAHAGRQIRPGDTRRAVFLVSGSITVFIAFPLLAGATVAGWTLTKRDDAGFFMTGAHTLSTTSYAYTSESMDMGPDMPRWVGENFGTVRVQVRSGKPVFVGIARTRDVQRYLAGVRQTTITDFETEPFSVTSHTTAGSAKPAAPGSQRFWRVESAGSGTQTVTWPAESGEWSAVAMNADGSPNVAIDARFGARVSALSWIAISLLVAGAVLGAVGGLLFLGARAARGPVPG